MELRNKVDVLTKNLKTVHAVVRTPKLCDMFHKAEQQYRSEMKIAKENQEAFLYFRQQKVNEANSQAFIKDLV